MTDVRSRSRSPRSEWRAAFNPGAAPDVGEIQAAAASSSGSSGPSSSSGEAQSGSECRSELLHPKSPAAPTSLSAPDPGSQEGQGRNRAQGTGRRALDPDDPLCKKRKQLTNLKSQVRLVERAVSQMVKERSARNPRKGLEDKLREAKTKEKEYTDAE